MTISPYFSQLHNGITTPVHLDCHQLQTVYQPQRKYWNRREHEWYIGGLKSGFGYGNSAGYGNEAFNAGRSEGIDYLECVKSLECIARDGWSG